MSVRTAWGLWFGVHVLMPARQGAGQHRARAQRVCLPALCLAYLFLAAGAGADRYVATNGSHSSSYTTWATAATNIQAAVAVATNGEAIWVSNGTYYVTNGPGIDMARTNTLKSMNGPAVTIVDGMNTSRCFYIRNQGVVVDGFTLTNGRSYADGAGNLGGAFRILSGGTIQNCIISGNNNLERGGAGWIQSTNALVQNCVVSGNTASSQGGAFHVNGGGTIKNCTIRNNRSAGYGGGIYIESPQYVLVEGCSISENTSGTSSGGGVMLNGGGYMRNCLLLNNVAEIHGGGFFAQSLNYYGGRISSCTVVSNYAARYGGGSLIDQVSYNTNSIVNCIVYSNTAGWGSGHDIYASGDNTNSFLYCCATWFAAPKPDAGNISAYPQFADTVGGDYRLRRGSPCINTGTNEAWMEGAVDFDGHARRDRFSGIADMGCYEYIPSGSMITVR